MKTLHFIFLTIFVSNVIAGGHVLDAPDIAGPPRKELKEVSSLHALAGDPGRVAIKGYVQNNCPFPIYTQYAWCCPPDARAHGETCVEPLQVLEPNTGYWTTRVARNDRCSQTVRIFPDRGFKSVYQLEYSVDPNGDVWYNLSSVDGDPFNAYPRFLVVKDTWQWMYCRPGDSPDRCDWPFHEGFCDAADVRFYLC